MRLQMKTQGRLGKVLVQAHEFFRRNSFMYLLRIYPLHQLDKKVLQNQLSSKASSDKMHHFWPRATLKGPKRSFVVVLLVVLLGVETCLKNVPNWTKIVQGNKKSASVAHYGIELPCLPCMALCGLLCPYVSLYGLMCPCMALMLLFMAMAVWHH